MGWSGVGSLKGPQGDQGPTGSQGPAGSAGAAGATGPAGPNTIATATDYGTLSDPAAGTAGLRTLGTGATQAAAGTDSRFTNARTPTAHAASHASGASDPITPAAIGAAARLTETAVKTAAYTAAVGELVRVDDSAGNVTITAPACSTGALWGIRKVVSSSFKVTAQRAGTDTIGGAGATSEDAAKLIDQTVIYQGNGTVWTPERNFLRLGSLDTRYALQSAADSVAATASIRTLGTGATQATAGNDARLSDERDSPAAKANAANGWAKLDGSALLPQAIIPAIALTEYLGSVASQAAMLALTGQRGDWAYRSDLGTDWQLVAEPSTSLASWQERHYPASPVSSVNGRTGGVTGLAEASALSGYQPIDSDLTAIAAIAPADGSFMRRVSGAWAEVTTAALKTALALVKADVGLGSVDNTADTAKPVSTAQQTALDLKLNTLGPVAAKTGSYTLTDNDAFVVFNTTSGAMNATLPTAVGRAGRRFTIKKLGGTTANPLTILCNGAETIDAATSEPISVAGGFREVISDGSNWHVISGKVEPVIVNAGSIAAAGTWSIDASIGSTYTATAAGSTISLAVPTNPIDRDMILLELVAPAGGTTLTINASILLTTGLTATIAVAASKRWFGGLRYVAGVGWFLISSTAQL